MVINNFIQYLTENKGKRIIFNDIANFAKEHRLKVEYAHDAIVAGVMPDNGYVIAGFDIDTSYNDLLWNIYKFYSIEKYNKINAINDDDLVVCIDKGEIKSDIYSKHYADKCKSFLLISPNDIKELKDD